MRLLAALPAERVAAIASQLGFEAPQRRVASKRVQTVQEPAVASVPHAPVEITPLPLYRLEKMTFVKEHSDEVHVTPTGGLTHEDLHSPGHSLFATPRSPPLAPWSRLWPSLRSSLHGTVPGREPDVPKLLHMWTRGESLHQIPRIMRRVWAERVSVWVDRSARLTPFQADQEEVCQKLHRCCGHSGLKVRFLDPTRQAVALARQGDFLAGVRLEPGQSVLVLGDLGAYATAVERAAWLRTGQRLRGKSVHIAALLPVPPSRWPQPHARGWSAVAWERGRLAALSTGHQEPTYWQARAERLLRLISPAALVQPGLLRALRLLLPASEADASTEVDVFRHSEMRAADAMGMVLSADAAARLRKQFGETESTVLKAKVSETVGRWHLGLPRELLRIETLTWLALEPQHESPPPGDAQDALGFAQRLTSSLRFGAAEDRGVTAAVRRCAQTMLGALPDSAYQSLPGLARVWAAAYAGVVGVRVPEGLDPDQLYAEQTRVAEHRFWSVRQVGDSLSFTPSKDGAWPSHKLGPGSPIAWLRAAGPHLFVKWGDAAESQCMLEEGLQLPLQRQKPLTLRSDLCTITIAPWSKEPWATAAGRDRYGLWADASIEGIAVRFRYIPPGRFLMGSPESEAGRHESEGPQHEVTWTQGYWLADTPCTQAVWERVMGGNPSYFTSTDRPVELVSWDDCQEFVKRLNERSPELMARLPSEAEWEYACRGGTPTATWVGDLEILGEGNAPLLDEIAWYGGNSWQDYELEQGVDGTDWPNKLYPHTKAGTHEVRKKQANPHGLHDMLGNVLEWCMDTYGSYEEPAVTNPAPSTMGTERVNRGGSWYSRARRVRAALRDWNSSGIRSDSLGFRLARGQGGWEAGTRSGPVGRGESSNET